MWLGASMADDAQRRDLSKKVGYGSATPPGDATSPTRQTPPGLGPNSPSRRELLADSWQPSPGLATTWGPYFQALFPPGRVTAWDNFKRMSTGVNIARRLWDQREEMLQEYEALHGTHHAQWPTQHPGVVLDAVQWVAHPACLACHWFSPRCLDARRGLANSCRRTRAPPPELPRCIYRRRAGLTAELVTCLRT
jgi:hypothetical protein